MVGYPTGGRSALTPSSRETGFPVSSRLPCASIRAAGSQDCLAWAQLILIVFVHPPVNQQPRESKIAPMDTNPIVKFLPLVPLLLALVCVLVQALMPVSRTKGNTRLAGSILLGGGLSAESLIQMASQHGFWPEVTLLPMGGVLIWLGVRKHSRDPEGKTPPAAIL
jgi:hypothetical protein